MLVKQKNSKVFSLYQQLVSPLFMTPTQEQIEEARLAEAKKLMEGWPKTRSEGLRYLDYVSMDDIDDLIEASALIAASEQREAAEKELKGLRHFKDSSVGLWCTDKEPQDKTNFFQLL